ncbi:hypothetical protein [Nonomuraea bangladeshensis]|uniref:hypothetical protein n=1 Tax=Nonomuraea bangladeshensis TaxID=404385 RepID=UPI003C2E4F93
MPANLSVVDAPAVPTSAMAALQASRKIANVRPGQTVLVTGTSGAYVRPNLPPLRRTDRSSRKKNR